MEQQKQKKRVSFFNSLTIKLLKWNKIPKNVVMLYRLEARVDRKSADVTITYGTTITRSKQKQ